jgi:hypothetical protein
MVDRLVANSLYRLGTSVYQTIQLTEQTDSIAALNSELYKEKPRTDIQIIRHY